MTRSRTAQNRPGDLGPSIPVRRHPPRLATRHRGLQVPKGDAEIGAWLVKAALLDRYPPALGVVRTWVEQAALAGADPSLAHRMRSGLQGGPLAGLAVDLERAVPLKKMLKSTRWELL